MNRLQSDDDAAVEFEKARQRAAAARRKLGLRGFTVAGQPAPKEGTPGRRAKRAKGKAARAARRRNRR